MLQGVGQGLLHHTIGGQVNPRRQVSGLSLRIDSYGEPGAPQLPKQVPEISQPRLWGEFGLLRGAPEHSERPPKFRHGLLGDLLNRQQYLTGPLGLLGYDAPRGSSLDADDTHTVGYHVVDLTRDPGSFRELGTTDLLRPFPLGTLGTLAHEGPFATEGPNVVADDPGPPEVDEVVDDVAERIMSQLGQINGEEDGERDGGTGEGEVSPRMCGDGVRPDDGGKGRVYGSSGKLRSSNDTPAIPIRFRTVKGYLRRSARGTVIINMKKTVQAVCDVDEQSQSERLATSTSTTVASPKASPPSKMTGLTWRRRLVMERNIFT